MPLDGDNNPDYGFEFLQQDLTWGNAIHFFLGKENLDIYKNFETIYFNCTFDEVGQYDFYAFSFSNDFPNKGLNKYLANEITQNDFFNYVKKASEVAFQKEVKISNYSVMVEYNKPYLNKEYSLPEIETTILAETGLGALVSPITYGLFIKGVENKLHVCATYDNVNYIFEVKEYKDVIIFDIHNSVGATIEDYETVSISINNGEYEETVSYD